jgi:hypothetical protein
VRQGHASPRRRRRSWEAVAYALFALLRDAISKLKEGTPLVFADLERDAKAFPRALRHGPERIDEVVIWVFQRLSLQGPASACDRGDDGTNE